jgi:Ca-activated chloride channel family protein
MPERPMSEWLSPTGPLLPLHWLRPWALWGLLAALALLVWGRRTGGSAVPPGVIDEALLPHLLVQGGRAGWLRPGDTLAAAVACFSIALAGPAWQREAAPLALEAAPLIVVLDLSDAMDAADLPPSRLDRARAKLQRLLAQRGDAPTGLVVYAGSAHLVLPPTQDRQVLASYLDVLATALMPTPGNVPADALALAQSWAERAAAPGTLLFLTADWPAADLDRTEALLQGSRQRLAVWAIGTPEGGPLRTPAGQLRTDAQGRSRQARLDVAGLQALRDRTGADLVAVTQDDIDLARVQALIARHRADAVEQDPSRRWLDRGPLFIWPGLLALLMSFRRGWTVGAPGHAAAVLLAAAGVLTLVGVPGPAWAQADAAGTTPWRQRVVNWWLTPDQQGRWWLERGDAARAALHFADPFWRGVAHGRAGQWQAAADAFARVDSAAAWFNQAQMLARLGRYPDAVAAYDQALLRLPGWPEAVADRERVRGLIPPPPAADDGASDGPPGDGDGSEPGQRRPKKAGPPRPLTDAEMTELWLQRLDTSPAGFLQRKFALQVREPTKPIRPPAPNPGTATSPRQDPPR